MLSVFSEAATRTNARNGKSEGSARSGANASSCSLFLLHKTGLHQPPGAWTFPTTRLIFSKGFERPKDEYR